MANHIKYVEGQKLRSFVEQVLVQVGVSSVDARVTADVLVAADISGIDSHGVVRLSHYIRRLDNGTLKKQPNIRFERKAPAIGLVDGDDGLGHVVMTKACDWAAECCGEVGTFTMVINNSSHFGMAGYYVNRLTEEGLAAMIMTHTDRLLIPYGGSKPFWGSNPIAVGFPTSGIPLILDMSTTSIPFGKVVLAQKEGREIPADWGFDDMGKPTKDPNRIVGLHPIAGPKGSGLAMVIDIFCSLLSGMAYGPHIIQMYQELESARKLGHFLTVWDIKQMVEPEVFINRIDQMVSELHAIPPAEGFSHVFFPGEREGLEREGRSEEGIPIEAGLYTELEGLGQRFGVALSSKSSNDCSIK
jgi:ureidoglycolate dehydrogenase (NAD+)